MTAPFSRREASVVGGLLVLAAALRLPGLAWAPPAINQDEASNAYDAYSILETGADRWGHRWPILLEAFGRSDHRPALYAYLTVPFIGVLGVENATVAVRLPAALCGVLTIACLYVLVRRVCDPRVAFWASLFLILSPWHLQLSRFGHEAALTPLFPVLALLTLSLAGWPLNGKSGDGDNRVTLRWPWMVAFGVAVGLAPYSYASMKLFLPALLLVAAVVYRRTFRAAWRDRGSRVAMLAALAAMIVVLAPMAWLTATQWDKINQRAENVSVFHQGWGPGQVIRTVATHYVEHFGWDWLFAKGDTSPQQSILRGGQVNGYLLPLLPLGMVALVVGWRRNRVYALLLAWLLLHPIAGALTASGAHALRSACGLGAHQWLAATGIVFATSMVRSRMQARVLSVVCAAVVLGFGGNMMWRYFGTYARHPYFHCVYQTDLRDAVLLIRDRWQDYDRVFISDQVKVKGKNGQPLPDPWFSFQPYVYVLLYLPVEPAVFQAWDKTVLYRPPEDQFHVIRRMGPFVMSTRPDVLHDQFTNRRQERALFIVRPGELDGVPVLHHVLDAYGRVRFEIKVWEPS